MKDSSPRSEAERRFGLGNGCSTQTGNANLFLSIEHYRSALFNVKCIKKAEFGQKDQELLSHVLAALLNAINGLVKCGEATEKIVEELGKFFALYIMCAESFDKQKKIMPGLTKLNETELAAFFKKLALPAEKGCVEIYMAIVSLFHENIQPATTYRELPDDEQSVKQAFQWYQRVLDIYKRFNPEPVPVVTVPSAPVTQAEPILKKSKTKDSSQQNSAHRVSFFGQYRPHVGIFDYVASDEPKREAIRKMMAEKKYGLVIKCYICIMNKTEDDYRKVRHCYEKQAEIHKSQGQIDLAQQCYQEALNISAYIKPVSDEDEQTLQRLSEACALLTESQPAINKHGKNK